jgi:colicin import membrane protein
MTRQLQNRYPGPGGMFALSLAVHLVIFLVIIEGDLLPAPHQEEQQVTYVDIATLPVASPQSGTPAPSAESAPASEASAPPAPAPPPPPPAPRQAEMALPAPKAKAKAAPLPKPTTKRAKETKQPASEDAQEFNERLAKLERQAEDKQLSNALARLKAKRGRTGMPGASGTQAGSDYASYVKSRLRDALRERMNLQSKSPVVIATITIGSDGRIDYRPQKSSGDPLFDEAVAQAVTLAGKSIKPPPGGGQFKSTVTFKPDSVGVR